MAVGVAQRIRLPGYQRSQISVERHEPYGWVTGDEPKDIPASTVSMRSHQGAVPNANANFGAQRACAGSPGLEWQRSPNAVGRGAEAGPPQPTPLETPTCRRR